MNSLVAVGAILGSLGGSGEGDEHVGAVDTAGRRVASMQTTNELMNSSEEFRLLFSGQGLTTEQRQQLEKDLQATAAQYGLTVEQFIFYLKDDLSGGRYSPGDPAKGVPGSTVGVNMVGEDGKLITGAEALERIFHEYGHPAYGPGKESAAASLGSFASWYGRNILANLYGLDPTRQTQTASDYIRDYADVSLARNTMLALNMQGSKRTEYIDAPQYAREDMVMWHLQLGMITPEEAARRMAQIAEDKRDAHIRVGGLGDMVGGTGQMVGGFFMALAGGATSETGVGLLLIPAGGVVFARGGDVYTTGWNQLVTGQVQTSASEQLLVQAGVSRAAAKQALFYFDLGSAFAAPWATARVGLSAETALSRGGSVVYYADDLAGAGVKEGAAFTSMEMNALREAGLSHADILKHVELNGDLYLFRGTSVGWSGSPGAQATAVSASTDPYIATVFALESRGQGGRAAIFYGERSKFGTFDMGNWMAKQEREVGVLLRPDEFAIKAPYSVSPDKARQVLHDMGFPQLPYSIQNPSMRSTILDAAPKMTPEQIREFIQRVEAK